MADEQRHEYSEAAAGDERVGSASPPASEVPTGDLATRSVAAGKADVGKRIVAGLIDAGLAIVIGFIPLIGGLVAAAYWLTRDGLTLEFMNGRSLGKAVMNLTPVRLDGAPMDLETSFRRNWMFALGGLVSLLLFIPILGWLLAIPLGLAAFAIGVLELYLVITNDRGRRWGDKLAGTQVQETAA